MRPFLQEHCFHILRFLYMLLRPGYNTLRSSAYPNTPIITVTNSAPILIGSSMCVCENGQMNSCPYGGNIGLVL